MGALNWTGAIPLAIRYSWVIKYLNVDAYHKTASCKPWICLLTFISPPHNWGNRWAYTIVLECSPFGWPLKKCPGFVQPFWGLDLPCTLLTYWLEFIPRSISAQIQTASWYHPPDSTLPQKEPTGIGSNLNWSQFQLTFWDFIVWIWGSVLVSQLPLNPDHCGLMIICQSAHLGSQMFQMTLQDILEKIQ